MLPAVATGVPRDLPQTITFQAMRGAAAFLQNGAQPADLRNQGTSPVGCTIGGVMVLEDAGVRGSVGRCALCPLCGCCRYNGCGFRQPLVHQV